MMLALGIVCTLLVEFAMYAPVLWPHRRIMAVGLICIIPGLSAAFAVAGVTAVFVAAGIGLLSIFRIINLLRIVTGRLPEPRLLGAAMRASGWFGLVQLVLVAIAINELTLPSHLALWLLAGAQVITATAMWFSARSTLRAATPIESASHAADRDLPTVSVLVPARNETPDLADCIHSLLASNYPKLEIIVLDDCSHDKTPDIIKDFSHDGVRFIQGGEPGDNWLPKNYAYQRLAEEATGELLLFCGVDVRLEPDSIRQLVLNMQQRSLMMACVLPERQTGLIAGANLLPLRYWWELAVPRQLVGRPAAVSTCWIVQREALQSLGGFKAVRRSVIPEGFFARAATAQSAYALLRSSQTMTVTTVKTVSDQRETSLRLRYPQVRKKLELSLLLATLEVLLLIAPMVLAPVYLLLGEFPLAVATGISVLLLLMTHYAITHATAHFSTLKSLAVFPLTIIVELITGLTSMQRYEFGTVDWKGRNICYPVMHVVPRLPRLPE